MEARSQLRHRPNEKQPTLLAYHRHLRIKQMVHARRSGTVVVLATGLLLLCSCASRDRTIVRADHPASQVLLTATKRELLKRLVDNYEAIRSFNATVDLTSSVGSVNKGKIKDYTDITAFIFFRAPGDVSVVGLLPVVHTTAFHMVSDGKEFRVSIPVKNRFIEGRNDAPGVSPNKFENIRPQTFISGMLVRPVDPATEIVILVDDTTETTASYQLAIIHKVGNDFAPFRRVTFDRVNLQVTEQREYDENGLIVSLTKYGNFKIYDNIRFASRIEITRPKDEYGLSLVLTKMEINKPIEDARFTLAKPEGAEVHVIGASVAAPVSDFGKSQK